MKRAIADGAAKDFAADQVPADNNRGRQSLAMAAGANAAARLRPRGRGGKFATPEQWCCWALTADRKCTRRARRRILYKSTGRR